MVEGEQLDEEQQWLKGTPSGVVQGEQLDEEQQWLKGIPSGVVQGEQLDEEQQWLKGIPSGVVQGEQLDEEQEWLKGIPGGVVDLSRASGWSLERSKVTTSVSVFVCVCSDCNLVQLEHVLWAAGLRMWLISGTVELLRLGHR